LLWQLPYELRERTGEGLRPTSQTEMTYAQLRRGRAHVTLPVSSCVVEASGRPPEVAEIPCVSVTDTAAEKLVALSWRDLQGARYRAPIPCTATNRFASAMAGRSLMRR
jgi:hypothetical protein